ncbi:DUF4198 domain-containing protein [Cupriavidus sp. 2TAF22]|uniref:DUF4198 domain-containing protein n=1 Tax=unclassified Cupriavidus TaxID=2640874 RepID=UPI003F938E15
MKQHAFLASIALALTCAAFVAPARAHYLWLEQDKVSAHLYFGEYEEMLRERSPGRLDEMPGPEIRALGRDGQTAALTASREAGGFRFASQPRGIAVLASEGAYAVKDWTHAGLGVVKPMFYARLIGESTAAAEVATSMPLDILPTGSAGEYRVVFRGTPLAAADVRVIASNAWTREATTGKDGLVRFAFPWRGQYILHVIHLERTPGTFDGTAYAAVRHRATATLTIPAGPRTTAPATWQASPPH